MSDRFRFEDLYHIKEIKMGVEDDKKVLSNYYDAFNYLSLIATLKL